jgi:hypothetical protein
MVLNLLHHIFFHASLTQDLKYFLVSSGPLCNPFLDCIFLVSFLPPLLLSVYFTFWRGARPENWAAWLVPCNLHYSYLTMTCTVYFYLYLSCGREHFCKEQLIGWFWDTTWPNHTHCPVTNPFPKRMRCIYIPPRCCLLGSLLVFPRSRHKTKAGQGGEEITQAFTPSWSL